MKRRRGGRRTDDSGEERERESEGEKREREQERGDRKRGDEAWRRKRERGSGGEGTPCPLSLPRTMKGIEHEARATGRGQGVWGGQ